MKNHEPTMQEWIRDILYQGTRAQYETSHAGSFEKLEVPGGKVVWEKREYQNIAEPDYALRSLHDVMPPFNEQFLKKEGLVALVDPYPVTRSEPGVHIVAYVGVPMRRK